VGWGIHRHTIYSNNGLRSQRRRPLEFGGPNPELSDAGAGAPALGDFLQFFNKNNPF